MAYLDPNEAYAQLKEQILHGIQTNFPVRGKVQSLHLEKLEVKESLHPDDIRGQHKAKVEGSTWAEPVYAHLVLQDNETGKVIDRRAIRVAEIPRPTKRYSHIVDGQEYQVDNQWQLQPGIYARRKQNGELESRFNVTNGRAFAILFDPASKQFSMEYGKSNLPLYPIMKTMGVDDDTIEKSWGKEVLHANKTARGLAGTVERFYKSDKKVNAPSKEVAEEHLVKVLSNSELRPNATLLTLGKSFDRITGESLHLATDKLLKVQRGAPEDDRDSLIFKDLRSVGDFAFERLKGANRVIQTKVTRKVNQANDIRDVIKFDLFNEPIKQTFTKNNAARTASQINPVEMVSSALQTTIMGPGGIQSEQSVSDQAKFVNPTHLGFLDPLCTPEGEKTGVTLRLPLGVKKVGHEPRIPLYSLKTGKTELVSPGEFFRAKVALPDQIKWVNNQPKPLSPSIRMAGEGKILDGKFEDVQYVLRHPSQLFNITTNLIPFLGNTSGNRAGMASRHIEQAISLVHREAPLVQVSTGISTPGIDTFENLIGRQAAHVSPVNGIVHEVKHDAIVIKSKEGDTHEVSIYRNYPLNDTKSVMDSTAVVKVGDKVSSGQVIADTNYARNGALALGTNLRVGYIPYKGYNFEDGIVISESAAKKLTSTHLHKHMLPAEESTILSPRKYMIEHPGVFKKDQYEKLGSDGVIRIGQKVQHGDPLIVAMKPYLLKDKQGLGAIRRSLSGAHTDKSLRWDSEAEGEVVGAHHTKDGITVYVKTQEPMTVGDKLSGRHGNKGICFDPETQVLTELGWKYFSEVTISSKICTLNTETREIEYQEPTRLIEQDHDGPMYRFKGRRLDLMTTPEHKHYVRTPRSKEYRLESASSCFDSTRVHLRTGIWQGVEKNEFVVPGRERRPNSKQRYEFDSPRTYDMDDFLEFFGYWISEGSLDDTSHISIAQRESVNPEIYADISAVLTRLGYTFYVGPDSITLSDPRLHAWLSQFGTSLTKFLPRELLTLPPRQLRILADALFAGDGGVYFREKDNHTRYELFTSSARLADDYQELAFKLGMSANIKPQRRADRNVEYVVRWSLKDEVFTQKDSRYESRSEEWVSYKGKVYCAEVPNHVLYIRRNGIPVWSGNCTSILPDHEMPHTPDGKHIEVALNPSGVPGRMNIGQVLETAVSKIALKTGKPYIVKNFEPNVDFLARVKEELKQHNLSDTELLHDPTTKQDLGKALVGHQHMFKLVHQVDKKISARSGMSGLPGMPGQEHYDLNLQPTGGSGTGGMSMGVLGMYSLLAHGAKANLREMQTWKSEGPDPQTSEVKRWPSQHSQVWTAIQTGMPLPTPTSTFAFKKFEDMLKATGINMEKKGHQFVLSPLTDKQILGMSAGPLPKPSELLFAKPDKSGDPKPKTGGLFDEKLTGGHGGRKWSHINLAEPIPNPVFELPIRHLTGLSQKEFNSILHGEKAVTAAGQIVSLGAGVTGGQGIKTLLDKIDVPKELEKSKKELSSAPASKMDKTLKKVKYLQALDQLKLSPSEAYVLHHLPVIPPVMRPVSLLPSGDYKTADLNGLYSEFSQVNDKLKDPILSKNLPDEAKRHLRESLYDGVKAIMGIGVPYGDATQKGILHQISGSQPKAGYFQHTLMNRRQDLTMRSTIVPEPSLGLDEVGLPKEAALNLFRPFVVRQLIQMGVATNPLDAQKELVKKGSSVWRALDKVLEERPVLLKRDPVLHKHSVQAFKAKAVSGSAIQIHPLVTGGFGADFDGDAMAVFVPLHQDAVAEAHKMFPSNNLFSEATGRVMYQPTLESALGLYKLSIIGKDSNKQFKHPGEVLDAVRNKHIGITDTVKVGSQKTTAGRILLSTALPEPMQNRILEDHSFTLNRKGLDTLLTDLAKSHGPDFGVFVNKLKDIGNGASFGSVAIPHPENTGVDPLNPRKTVFVPMGTHSLSLDDFTPDTKMRKEVLDPVRAKVQEIYANPNFKKADKDRRAIILWDEADRKMRELHEKQEEKRPDNLFQMYQAGVKPGWEQYKQMKIAPMLMTDSSNKTIPTPITKSYAEGLGLSDYWIGMHGARRGAVMKVQEVQQPGYMSKLLMNNMMHLLVNSHDCGTEKGVSLDINEKDVHDRHLAQDFRAGALHIPKDSLLTPDIVGKIKAAKKDAQIVVRSPLKCEEEKGLCQKCVGLSATGHHHGLGTNVGVMSAHAVGERAVQLTLKAFHTGGVQEGGKNLLNSFARFEQLTYLPQKIPNSASLAMTSGKIDKIEQDPTGVKIWIGSKKHFVPKDENGLALHEDLPHMSKVPGYQAWAPPKVGLHVEAGQFLSDPNRTLVNPHTLYAATGSIEKVQNHLAKEIYDLYKNEGLKRRTIEVVVKAMSNLTKIQDPGDHHEVLRGEFRPTSVIKKINAGLEKEGKRPIEHTPVLKGVAMMPLSLQEDWMAKLQHQRLTGTLLDAVALNGASNIHGNHPIPALAFGAEFGMTSKDSLKPGFGHLKDVPSHHY